ncbi:HAMP domain-containing histidine kinase [Cohnella ginsengisoli]|uniref:histidine kinase n=1 Tax=Cohnella ginsengisoli TaxID=425004 RepID=A0A9X4KF26_9BACL|nr:HAMP domain-containing sensor histidine kinase [Cohnella ginsengisoli]MDG0790913.1 HAMP domain-containing histidine kinase [Cohnella ginsengisoli]
MNPNPLFGLRFKLLVLVALSLGFAAGTAALLYFLAVRYDITILNALTWWFYERFGRSITLAFAILALFIVYLFVFSHGTIRYLLRITQGVGEIAEGRFDSRIPVRTSDELGVLADRINGMSERLKRSIEEERRTERAKTELVTNVSHDLRTPLTSIVGYLGLIEQDRYRDEVELRHYTGIAYDKALRLQGLINDLFEYTRTSGGLQLRLSPLNLVEMLGQLAVQFRLQFEQAGIEGVAVFAEKELTVAADGDKLVRVFENLIDNAIRYGRNGGRIEIRARREGTEAVAEIVNYGEPLPASAIPLLFDRFYRLEQSRSRHTGGSGLGLAIAKNIVELHGGAISAFSGVGVTTFQVRLPLAR